MLPEQAAMKMNFGVLEREADVACGGNGTWRTQGEGGCGRRLSGRRVLFHNMVSIGRSDDDVIDDFHIQRSADLLKMPCCEDIFRARRRVAAWMVVDEDDAGCIMLKGAAEDGPWIKGKLAQRSLLQLFVRNQPACVVEKQDAQGLVDERPHRGDEVTSEFRAERIDANAPEITRHCLEGCFACTCDKGDDWRRVAEDAAQRFRACRPYPADALELAEKCTGYPVAIGGFDWGDESRQDGSLPCDFSRC